MEGLHFIMLLSMGAALELKLFSNKVMCICIYGHFFVTCTFLLPCVYTLPNMLIKLDLHVLTTGKT